MPRSITFKKLDNGFVQLNARSGRTDAPVGFTPQRLDLDISNPCWVWNGMVNGPTQNPQIATPRGNRSVVRVISEAHPNVNPELIIARGSVCFRQCSTPRCVNPAHHSNRPRP